MDSADKEIPDTRQVNRHPLKWFVLMCSVLISCAVVMSCFFPWDRQLSAWLVPYGEEGAGHVLTDVADLAGNGFYQAILPGIIALYAWRRHYELLWRRMLFVIASIVVSGLLVNILKFLVGRARPGQGLDAWFVSPFSTANDFHSFPSGHTSTSFAMAYMLSAFYPSFALLWYLAALFIALGRVMGESHFLTDTLAGAVLGIATGWLLVRAGTGFLNGDRSVQGPFAGNSGENEPGMKG